MIPIYLDPTSVRVALVGNGALAVRRLAWLEEGGGSARVWSPDPQPDLIEIAGAHLTRGLPSDDDLQQYDVVWIADLPREDAARLAKRARAAKALVNVEDVVPLCDFHTPAVVRRGKLTLAAGTGGASPAVARAARERLEQAFPSAWEDALEEIARSRADLRARSATFETLVADARQRLAHHGLV